ncbi:MAG: hypothetical protein ACREBT_01870 [Thermoplasmata archaeon]
MGWDGAKRPRNAGRPGPSASAVGAAGWAVVGVIGLLLLALGVWTPAWQGVAGGAYASLGVAALGGALVVIGFTFAWRSRAPPRVPIEEMAGVEVFHPAPEPGGDPASTATGPRTR